MSSNGSNFVPTEYHDTYPTIHPAKADLKDKVVAITGASKGIGKGIALAFAQAGASGILLIARSPMAALESETLAAGRPGRNLKVASISVDTTDATQAARAAEKAREVFGRLDVLVNNAGVMESLALRTTEVDPAVWWKTWEVNMLGTFNITRAFIPLLLEGGDKTVLNLSSIAAHFVAPGGSAYYMTKMAILRYSELLVAEYGDKGLISIALHPGSIKTDMSLVLGPEWDTFLQETVELAAHSTVWLARERREWLNGRYVSALWDVDELEEKKQEIVDGDKLKLRMIV